MSSKLENACLTTCEIQPSGTTSSVVVNGSSSDKITYMIASNFNAGYLKKPTSTKITNNSDNTITTLAVASGKTPDLPVCCVKQGSKNLQFCIGSNGEFCCKPSYSLGTYEGAVGAPPSYVLLTSDGYIPVGMEFGKGTPGLGGIMDPFYNKTEYSSALRMSTFSPTTNDCDYLSNDKCISYMMTARSNHTSNSIKDIIVFDEKDTDVYVCLCYYYEINVNNCGRQIDYSYCYCPTGINFNLRNPRQRVLLCAESPTDNTAFDIAGGNNSLYRPWDQTITNVDNHVITSRDVCWNITDASRLCVKATGKFGNAETGTVDGFYNRTVNLTTNARLFLYYNRNEPERYSCGNDIITLKSVKIDCKFIYGASGDSGKENKTYSGKGEVKVSLT